MKSSENKVVEDPTRNGVLLGLILTNGEGLVGDVKVGDNLGCSDHEIVEFSTGQGGTTWTSCTTMDFRRLTLASSAIFFEEPHGNWPCREEDPRSLPPGSRMMYSNE
ncbi:hypothetical protein BTVI_148159 [Pitangus sulphuratus]|nr:hypothetical protein BTVI_148159 [Pitangus sulphuratus]